MNSSTHVQQGLLGELFWSIADSVIVFSDRRVVGWNPAAEATFGVTAAEATAPGFRLDDVLGDAAEVLWRLLETGSRGRLRVQGSSPMIFEARTWQLEGDGAPKVALLRNVTAEERHVGNLQRLNSIGRYVLTQDSFEVVCQRIVDEAKHLTRASFSAMLLLREDSDTEVAKFVYNAPRELFPDRLPRAVGLLAVPIRTRAPARLEDIRGHRAGAGIPVKHPPIAALLAVPISIGDMVRGELAVANQPGEEPFDDFDEAVLMELAAHAAQACELFAVRAAKADSDEAKRTLLDLARHDIKSPITVAKSSLQVLKDSGPQLGPEQQVRLVDATNEALTRVVSLTNELLIDESLQTSGLMETNDIEVAALLEQLQRDLTPVAKERPVALDFRREPSSPEAFPGSWTFAYHALENLITNAVKFSPQGTTVAVTSRGEGSSVRFDVSDHGPGIAAGDQSDLFKRFTRGEETHSRSISGTGLGLSIVKRVADAHGGAVGVASKLGEGSTFWLTFPLRSSRAKSPMDMTQ
jgi:signal transduction histidine kinase